LERPSFGFAACRLGARGSAARAIDASVLGRSPPAPVSSRHLVGGAVRCVAATLVLRPLSPRPLSPVGVEGACLGALRLPCPSPVGGLGWGALRRGAMAALW
jgi:hypothetical protein